MPTIIDCEVGEIETVMLCNGGVEGGAVDLPPPPPPQLDRIIAAQRKQAAFNLEFMLHLRKLVKGTYPTPNRRPLRLRLLFRGSKPHSIGISFLEDA